MASFNFEKKKEEKKTSACSCGCSTSEAEEITSDCCSETKDGNCCCSSECSTPAKKEVNVEYLFLDLNTCDRCIGTDEVLEDVLNDITPTFELAGYTVNYKKIEISTPELAEKYRFLSSPTIRVNGKDICETVMESDCGCCGDIAGVSVDCRVFEYEGKTYEVPTKEMLADAILKAFYAPADCSCTTYQIPENLKRFFEGKKNNESNCSCGCSCGCPTSEVDELTNDCCSES